MMDRHSQKRAKIPGRVDLVWSCNEVVKRAGFCIALIRFIYSGILTFDNRLSALGLSISSCDSEPDLKGKSEAAA